jgi:hypothetical protein
MAFAHRPLRWLTTNACDLPAALVTYPQPVQLPALPQDTEMISAK